MGLEKQLQCDQRIIAKVWKTLRPLAFPVGAIGIVDRDIKTNYLRGALDHTISVLLATN